MKSSFPSLTTYSRRILLAVTGLSPQVVTETLYALTVRNPHATAAFMPTEIHLLTTEEGKQRARASLLHPNGGQFHAFVRDYPQIGQPVFDERHIHVIRNAAGDALADIRTPDENAAAADAITALVSEFTRYPDSVLHVSIAGGRKTMGFYLGYAFSLFARPQDSLSHVLVSAPFESHPDFYFPPKKARRLALRDGAHIDTAQAEITLAEIPVVRLRHGLPKALQSGKTSYNEAVEAIQASLLPPRLTINPAKHLVRCGDHKEFTLSPALLAWLLFWVSQLKSEDPFKHWSEFQADDYLDIYRQIVSRDAASFENTQKRLLDEQYDVKKKFFEENNAKLEKAIKNAIGEIAARPYLLMREGKRPKIRRGLALSPEAITII
jgi:CRISPR-associated protein (TIGR02584 family)